MLKKEKQRDGHAKSIYVGPLPLGGSGDKWEQNGWNLEFS